MSDRKFPGLADSMQDAAAVADKAGLTLTHYNSGSAHNDLNGFRIYRGLGAEFFDDRHGSKGLLIHVTTRGEVVAFLAGWTAALRSA